MCIRDSCKVEWFKGIPKKALPVLFLFLVALLLPHYVDEEWLDYVMMSIILLLIFIIRFRPNPPGGIMLHIMCMLLIINQFWVIHAR